jgi:hypothetical protein
MEENTTVVEGQEEEQQQPIEEEAANEGGEEAAPETAEEEQQQSGQPDKLKANERIQQEIGRRKAEEERARALESRLNELEQRFTSRQEPEYIEITPQVQAQINNALANLEQQRIDAELEGDYLKAAHYRKEFDQVLQGIAENEQRMQKAHLSRQQQEAEAAKVQSINQRAEFYRQTNNIPPDQWAAANEWFAGQVNSNPVLGIQFREIADLSGPMAAVDWAVKYVQQNMAQPAQEATKLKIEQKTRLPGGTSQNTGQVLNQVKTLKAQAQQSQSSDDWANYFAAKRQLTSR